MTDLRHYLYRYERTGPKSITWNIVRELTADEYSAVGSAISTVYEAIRGVAGFAKVAHSDLDDLMTRLHAMAADESLRIRAETWPTHLQYRVVAVSAAIRMHEEHVLAAIRRRYGKESHEEQEAKRIFNEVFDGSLAYRVIYSLRNAVVHGSRGLVTSFGKSALVADGGGERIDTVIELRLRRDGVAKSTFKAAVRNEVVALTEDPDLVVFCQLALAAIKVVQQRLDSLVNPDLPAAVRLLRNYIDEVMTLRDIPRFHEHEFGQPHIGLVILGMTEGIAQYVLAATVPRA
ncbi:hypothetical protein [Cryobacterium sp. GrIS_2_6]|uniref:hypothetical protein n=1 Tax=Cryobacterium sp. GrIS_2_6 TaxID=3162785 RepID=UPI002E0909E2|nr:hypothetical protein [Cryobacterium psychrotolerans]